MTLTWAGNKYDTLTSGTYSSDASTCLRKNDSRVWQSPCCSDDEAMSRADAITFYRK